MSKAVKQYLDVGLERRVHETQKTRVREAWFRTKINPPADGFMSGMTTAGPWLCLNKSKELTATNTLYTVHFHNPTPLREQAAWALSLLCSTTAAQYATLGRSYSKGLLKFEPRDVMSLMVPRPVEGGWDAIGA